MKIMHEVCGRRGWICQKKGGDRMSGLDKSFRQIVAEIGAEDEMERADEFIANIEVERDLENLARLCMFVGDEMRGICDKALSKHDMKEIDNDQLEEILVKSEDFLNELAWKIGKR